MGRHKKEREPPEVRYMAYISNGKFCCQNETWRYYTILDNLRMLGMDLIDAKETAKWCGKTKRDAVMETDGIRIEIKVINN